MKISLFTLEFPAGLVFIDLQVGSYFLKTLTASPVSQLRLSITALLLLTFCTQVCVPFLQGRNNPLPWCSTTSMPVRVELALNITLYLVETVFLPSLPAHFLISHPEVPSFRRSSSCTLSLLFSTFQLFIFSV